jgi:hypothetical protein
MRIEFKTMGNGHKGVCSKIMIGCCAAAVLLGTGGGFVSRAATAEGTEAGTKGTSGPTLRLQAGSRETTANPVASFMYFVPLISPEPVTAVSTAGSTQATRITSVKRQQSGNSFTATCDIEFTGQGAQQSVFDPARQIKRHEQQLKAGGVLDHQLRSITVSGPGHGRLEVEGTVNNGVPTVTQVRLRFNAEGQGSPVSIGMSDIRYTAGKYRQVNDVVAKVNSLTFHRNGGTPKMEVSVASVKNKGAGDNLWSNFKASLKGAAANMLIQPLSIELAGHDAMMEFGQALAAGAPSFTFPLAKNLKQNQG